MFKEREDIDPFFYDPVAEQEYLYDNYHKYYINHKEDFDDQDRDECPDRSE